MSRFFKNLKDRTLTIAHRGASSLAPENTLSAARKAFDIGADMWELDVQMSADAELIVLHDKTLSRTSNIMNIPRFRSRWPWNAHQFTLAELKELDVGSWHVQTDPFRQIQAGAVFKGDALRYCGEKMLSLTEALCFSKSKDFRVNVELKNLSEQPGAGALIIKLVDLVSKLDMIDQVLVSSFNHEYLMQLKTAQPEISTAALVHTAMPDPIRLLQRLKVDALHASQKIATPEVIEKVKDHGFFVNVFTVNDKKSMDYFKTLGATGIITDFPQVHTLPR